MAAFKLIALLATFALSAIAQRCPSLPAVIPDTRRVLLPDPFTFIDGSKVRTVSQWNCRRNEIGELIQRYELGPIPPKPESVKGSISGNILTVTVTHKGNTIAFNATIEYPSSGRAPFPAMIGVPVPSITTPKGVALIRFNNDQIAEQMWLESRGKGLFYDLYGSDHPAGAIAAWVWGASRLIDGLESVRNSRIDTTKLAVTGCSRNGRGALAIGAFERRIALTIPQESGTGGAGCWRLADDLHAKGRPVQTAGQIITENVWFSQVFEKYAARAVNRVDYLPHDHHLLMSMVAPRGLLVLDHPDIQWLAPPSVYGCSLAAREVYEALSSRTSMGISMRNRRSHCEFPPFSQAVLQSFVDKFLFNDRSLDTDVLETDAPNNGEFTPADWIDWETPDLEQDEPIEEI